MSDRATLSSAPRLWAKGTPWAGLHGDALAFVLSRIEDERPVCVVVDGEDEAARMVRALQFFHPTPRRVEHLPADDVRAYSGFSPSAEVVQQRMRVGYRIQRGDALVVVVSAPALARRVIALTALTEQSLHFVPGEELEREDAVAHLTNHGYLAVPQVTGPGTFALRGDVLDVWSAGLNRPVRIEFFDDEIERVQQFHPRKPRAIRSLKAAVALPAREEPMGEGVVAEMQRVLGQHVGTQRRGHRMRRRIIEDVRAGVRFSGLEDYLTSMVDTVDPIDWLQDFDIVVVQPQSVRAGVRHALDTARRRWEDLDEEERPLVPPEERHANDTHLWARLKTAQRVHEYRGQEGAADLGTRPVGGYAVRGTDLAPVARKLGDLADKDARVALVADTARRATMLVELFEEHGVILQGRTHWSDLQRGELSLLQGDLPRGFVAPDEGWAFIPASALFGGAGRRSRSRAHEFFDQAVGSVADLKEGDAVVHKQHGIGLYRGLERMQVQGAAQDFVALEYAGGDLLYLPVANLALLSKYTAATAGKPPKLDKLGGQTWERRKGKVRDALLGKAQELLKLQARRELSMRPPVEEHGDDYRTFVARFPHQETEDQAKAIADIMEDLSAERPMDRLICGDVGFGKTEVAMRAVMRVVEAGHQAAVLCPTTVLAFQHFRTFQERFAEVGVEVGMLSRFVPRPEQKQVLARLASGDLKVVVGTHQLLGASVRFEDLRLVVVDEEHRFGVRQKNHLKKMRANLDILSMSATPIPRTLQMAIGGLREMSLIATPPQDRLSVRTAVSRFAESRVRDALLAEKARGGQSFVIHNRIETIDALADKLREWVPELSFRVAHGKMKAEHIEKLLLDFMEGHFDVLISTAIIESGVDIPNVNTMLVHRADMFGLSQLYQLRGRVGRSSVRGVCVLMTPDEITSDARKRLQVLADHTDLGAGFSVAAADLEIRGGGNLLGESQSGNIDEVGYEVWLELLEEAVESSRGHVVEAVWDPELEVPVPTIIPESFIPDMNDRIRWYQRVSRCQSEEQVDALLDEMESLLGGLPQEVRDLGLAQQIHVACIRNGVQRIRWARKRVRMDFHPAHLPSQAQLEALLERYPKRMQAEAQPAGGLTLWVRFAPAEGEKPLRFIRWAVARVEQYVKA